MFKQTLFLSSGTLRASTASLFISFISSRKRTPLCAIVISPGLGGYPEPKRLGILIFTDGLLKGGVLVNSSFNDSLETERITPDSIISSCSKGGIIPGTRSASMLFPTPGLPTIKIG